MQGPKPVYPKVTTTNSNKTRLIGRKRQGKLKEVKRKVENIKIENRRKGITSLTLEAIEPFNQLKA